MKGKIQHSGSKIQGAPGNRLSAAGALLLVAVLMMLAAAQVAQAQQPVPRIDDAELIFSQGVEAFEAGDYGMAYRRFRLVYDTYEVNRKTTAAVLMAAKSLYRDGQYQTAIELLDALTRSYPTSGYLDEARRVRQLAVERMSGPGEPQPVRALGIILPMGDADATLAQALFTGIRMAVDEHNQLDARNPIRMVFRASGADPRQVGRSVNELVQAGVEAIIGPLYSAEAREAARAAEQAGVVMVAPLANDEVVSQGRRFVFQANPTISMHGRMMARFAVRSLMLNDFGIIAERDREQISERMAEGFQEEAMAQGAEVVFYEVLRARADWSRLSDLIGADTMAFARALYLPVSGGETMPRIDAAITSLDRMNLGGSIRILGNTEWHEIPAASRASRYQATYTNDFYVDLADANVRAFMERFQRMNGRSADPETTTGRLAFTGYDVGRFLLTQITRSSTKSLRERLREAAAYQGLGIRIDFRNGNVNEGLYYFRYQDTGLRLLR